MRPYWALFKARARVLLQYRIAALAGVTTQLLFGFVMISVLMAFFQHSDAEQSMTLAQSVTYTWLGQAMLGMLPWRVDGEIRDSVRMGAVAYDLARPLDLYAHWYARAMAQITAPTLLRCFPIFVIATFLLPEKFAMQWPPLPIVGAWLLALMGALVLSGSIIVFMESTLFWTVSGDGITRIIPSFVTLFSGMVIPLPLMPDWMQAFLRYQPFATVSGGPSLIFSGVTPAAGVWEMLALQLFWSAFFVLLGRAIMRRGLSNLTVAGG